jgi:transposase
VIGEDRTEMLDLVPAQLRVKVVSRPRYGCRGCDGAVVQAPALERLIDGGMATEALVAHIVVSKFCDDLPPHRAVCERLPPPDAVTHRKAGSPALLSASGIGNSVRHHYLSA